MAKKQLVIEPVTLFLFVASVVMLFFIPVLAYVLLLLSSVSHNSN